MNLEKYKKAFIDKKSDAYKRGIKIYMTLEQFATVWEESGKWDQRGRNKGQYVMARVICYGTEEEQHDGDLPYDWDCIQIITVEENNIAASKGKILSYETRAKIGNIHRGKKLSVETKAKIGASLKGHKLSAETKAKLRDAHKGKTTSDETKAKMSAAKKGKKRGPCSDKTKAKISAAKKGKIRGHYKKKQRRR